MAAGMTGTCVCLPAGFDQDNDGIACE
ncbi:excalibur calcium-binding domain-containing protein [Nocardia sp. CY41]